LKLAYVFPGQGAQYVGMGQDLCNHYAVARETFKQADDALGFPLSELCFTGPTSDLRLTYHTQPALLTHSLAAMRVFQSESEHRATVVVGHSLGEYSALVAADVLSFTDAVKLVYQRGRFMDEAVPSGQGAMSAVLGLSAEELALVCEQSSSENEVAQLANVNCPGQIVISGDVAAVKRAGVLAKEKGARRVIELDVSGPFHSDLMRPAAEKLQSILSRTVMNVAQVPVMSNVDAKLRTQPSDICESLYAQLFSPVQFEQDILGIVAQGIDGFVEFGSGTVLSGLIKKIEKRIPSFHVEDESSLHETIEALSSLHRS